MVLTIEIPCNTGLEMENNLNKAIDDFGKALLKRGFSVMELTAFSETIESSPIYKVMLTDISEIVRLQNLGIEMANTIESQRKEIESLQEQVLIAAEQIPKDAFVFNNEMICKK